MDYELMGGDARAAIIAEDEKRAMKPFLPPAVPFGSKQWPTLITPGPGPRRSPTFREKDERSSRIGRTRPGFAERSAHPGHLVRTHRPGFHPRFGERSRLLLRAGRGLATESRGPGPTNQSIGADVMDERFQ